MKRDYLALWAILAVAFVLFFCLSTCDEIRLGSVHLKSSGMADAIFGREKVKEPDVTAEAEQADTVMEPRQIILGDGEKTVLLIGDSMLEGLSPRLAAYCEASGYKLYTVIWYSSTTELYGSTRLLSDYIDVLKPDYIFISLGGNELLVSDIAKKRDKYVHSIVDEVGEIPYLWIGPPNWREDTGINDLIAKNVAEGCMFVSNGMHFDRKRDGAHPTSASASVWMDSIMHWMPEHAHYVLPCKMPRKEKAKTARIYIHQPGELTNRPTKRQ